MAAIIVWSTWRIYYNDKCRPRFKLFSKTPDEGIHFIFFISVVTYNADDEDGVVIVCARIECGM